MHSGLAMIAVFDDKEKVLMQDLTPIACENLYLRARSDHLTPMDMALLHAATLTGIAVSSVSYPEASAVLYHYVYGDGSDLELPSEYFRSSSYLNEKITALGPGRHGPISFEQSRDWRLSLTMNPYYLDIGKERVRIWHPRIQFAPADGPPIHTLIPIGRLRLRLHDNLLSALHPTPFLVCSEWRRSAHD